MEARVQNKVLGKSHESVAFCACNNKLWAVTFFFLFFAMELRDDVQDRRFREVLHHRYRTVLFDHTPFSFFFLFFFFSFFLSFLCTSVCTVQYLGRLFVCSFVRADGVGLVLHTAGVHNITGGPSQRLDKLAGGDPKNKERRADCVGRVF